MAQGSFVATIEGWASEALNLVTAVRNESFQRVVEIMQTPVSRGGNMPVKSGFLRASLKASVGPSNFATVANPGPALTFRYDDSAIPLVLAGADLNDTVEAVYTAVYAKVANYGGEKRPARLFVNLAAQQWPRVVAEVAAEAEQRRRR